MVSTFFPIKVHLTKMTITRHWVCLAVPVQKRSRRRTMTLRRSTILIVIRVTRHLQRGSQKLEKLTRSILSHVIDVILTCKLFEQLFWVRIKCLCNYYSTIDLLGIYRGGLGTMGPPLTYTHANLLLLNTII